MTLLVVMLLAGSAGFLFGSICACLYVLALMWDNRHSK